MVTPLLLAATLHTGLGIGGVQVGSTSLFSVSPQIGIVFGSQPGPVLALRNTLMLMPTSGDLGVNNQVTIGAGYARESFVFTLGAMVAGYRFQACGDTRCGVVAGIAPGIFAQLDVFPTDRFGVSTTGGVGWYGGRSVVLPDSLVWSVIAGPMLRWFR